MNARTSPALNTDLFRKVHALMQSGATDGERAAAKARAEAIAKRAGMTLAQAVSSLDAQPSAIPKGVFDIFAGFDDWMEKEQPGYKAEKAAKRVTRDARDAVRRAEVLAIYGTESAVFARNAQEAALDRAVAPMATWDHWTDDEGVSHRYAATLDGRTPRYAYWRVEDITPAIRDAVMSAYPWPSTLDEALREVKAWDRLRWDRGLFCGGEWEHYAEAECRVALLEHELTAGRTAASWEDVRARFDWKQYEAERKWLDPTEERDEFMDRLRADFEALRDIYSRPVQSGHRSTADKRADVLVLLAAEPELTDREVARRCGVSPTTVGNLRRRASH